MYVVGKSEAVVCGGFCWKGGFTAGPLSPIKIRWQKDTWRRRPIKGASVAAARQWFYWFNETVNRCRQSRLAGAPMNVASRNDEGSQIPKNISPTPYYCPY